MSNQQTQNSAPQSGKTNSGRKDALPAVDLIVEEATPGTEITAQNDLTGLFSKGRGSKIQLALLEGSVGVPEKVIPAPTVQVQKAEWRGDRRYISTECVESGTVYTITHDAPANQDEQDQIDPPIEGCVTVAVLDQEKRLNPVPHQSIRISPIVDPDVWKRIVERRN